MKLCIAALVVVLAFAFKCHAQNASVYTDMWSKTGCKLVEQQEQGGYVRYLCKGPAGFKFESIEADIRQTLNIIEPSGKQTDLELMRINGYFSTAGPKIEWRMQGNSPVALIVRFTVDKGSETPRDEVSQLVVVKLAGGTVCITDVVKASRDQNIVARKLADDSAGKSCKSF